MAQDDITVLVPCAQNSFPYYEILAQSLRRRAAHPERLRFIISVNQPEHAAPYAALDPAIAPSQVVQVPIDDLIYRGQALDKWSANAALRVRSAIHERCVRRLLTQVQTRWVLIADADVAVFKDGWDKHFLSQLNDKTFMLGTCYGADFTAQYVEKSGSPIRRAIKFQNAPNMIFLLMDYERYKTLDVNMHLMESFACYGFLSDAEAGAGVVGYLTVSNLVDPRTKDAMGLPDGVGLWVDVGADLTFQARRHGLKWRGWRLERLNDTLNGPLPPHGSKVSAPEGYYDGDELVAIHYKKHTLGHKDLENWRRFVMDGLTDCGKAAKL